MQIIFSLKCSAYLYIYREEMKVLVAIKRVVDFNVKVRPKADESGADLANVKMAMNPFCEIAVEEAIRIKEQGIAAEVIAVSVGSSACHEQLRTALALGCDRAIHVDTDTDDVEPLVVSKLLAKVVEQEQPRVILLGKQAIDGDNNQVGQMLAGLAGCAQATFASAVKIESADATSIEVTREIDGGLQTLAVTLPAVVSTDLRLNEPRYASLPNIMKARSKPLATQSASEFGVEVANRVQITKVSPPPARAGGVIVESVEELVDKLKNEAKVI